MKRLLIVCAMSASVAGAADFESSIEPILHQRCYACHGPTQQMSGLRLDDREAALRGGYSGPAIVPGDAAASKLIARVSSEKEGFRMPPVGAPLSAAEVAALKRWIASGADWPKKTPTTTPTDEQKSRHWSFQPVQRPDLPAVRDAAWVRNPIDRFVLARLEADGVKPSPQADKITLLRRVYFDLIGLPPTPEEADRFLSDARPDAYERVVDKLLRSEHFGERWAIPWLDAARYADSAGYERDPLRPHAWRWRSWVIEAINRDVPFDRFTIEQLAGDLLPGASVEQRVATGFLRNGIKNREAGVHTDEKRFEETLDRVVAVGTAWLGLTVGCAQCHDHKYDPISQREMYRLFAFFNNAVERDIDAPPPGRLGPLMLGYPTYRAERDRLLAEAGVPELLEQWRAEMIRAMDDPGKRTDWDFRLTEWRAANDRSDWLMRAEDAELTDIERDKRVDWFLRSPGADFDKDETLKKNLKSVAEKIAALEAELLPERVLAYTMVERREPRPTHIALRGDWRSPGIAVEPGTPAVLPPPPDTDEPARLRLARWLVDGRNPLTPRVAVNRWHQELFGVGLVRTAEDFGTQGEPPSHPDLLDWLAAELIESGWSRKHVLRLMVASATYRQSSNDRPDLDEQDPDNRRLARQNRLRLQAELIRDNALAVSGLLDPTIGGESVHPPQPEGIAELSYSKKAWPEDRGPERYRRGLYIFIRRTSPYPFLMTFDASDTLTSRVRRERSNTPLQPLNLLNDPVFVEAAQGLALRAVLDADDSRGRLERIFRLALTRRPTPVEADRAATYFEQRRRDYEQSPEAAERVASYVPVGLDGLELAAWTDVARGLLNLDEFLTRE